MDRAVGINSARYSLHISFTEKAMDSRFEQAFITDAQFDAAYPVAHVSTPDQASELPQQSQPSILELNAIFIVLMTALAALLIVALFLATHF
jgi:hypothetical protein